MSSNPRWLIVVEVAGGAWYAKVTSNYHMQKVSFDGRENSRR